MCDGVLLSEPNEVQGGFLEIIPNSSAIVKNVLILQTLILDWKIWSDAPLMVQELLWKALQSLVRSDHRWVSFNIQQFKRARVVDKLLSALQVIDCSEVCSFGLLFLPLFANFEVHLIAIEHHP